MFLLVLFSFCLRSLSPLHTSNRGVTHSHQKSFIFLSTVARSVSPVEPSISLWVQHQLLTGLVLSKPLLSCHPGTPALLLSWARSLFPGLHVCLSYGLRPHFANVCYLIASSEKAQTNFLIHYVAERWASLVAQMVNKKKKTSLQCRRLGLIPGSERSPGEENGNPLQYSWLENSMDRGDWLATVHGVTKSQTQLSDWHRTHVAENAQRPLYFSPRCTLFYISASPENRTSRSEDYLDSSFCFFQPTVSHDVLCI